MTWSIEWTAKKSSVREVKQINKWVYTTVPRYSTYAVLLPREKEVEETQLFKELLSLENTNEEFYSVTVCDENSAWNRWLYSCLYWCIRGRVVLCNVYPWKAITWKRYCVWSASGDKAGGKFRNKQLIMEKTHRVEREYHFPLTLGDETVHVFFLWINLWWPTSQCVLMCSCRRD